MLSFMSLTLWANMTDKNNDERPRFNPQQFEQQLEAFVTKEAHLTQAEANAFLPLFREMRRKQIAQMEASRKRATLRPTSEKEWEERLRAHDNMEIQLKRIQQTYHNRMLKVVPASKLMKVIGAEDRFHRESFRKFHRAMVIKAKVRKNK